VEACITVVPDAKFGSLSEVLGDTLKHLDFWNSKGAELLLDTRDFLIELRGVFGSLGLIHMRT